jgi:hypothetical protein
VRTLTHTPRARTEYLAGDLRVADSAPAFIMAERIIGTWKVRARGEGGGCYVCVVPCLQSLTPPSFSQANKTQMNKDAARPALMSNIKQMRADGTYTNLIMDNVAEGRYRIEVCAPRTRTLISHSALFAITHTPPPPHAGRRQQAVPAHHCRKVEAFGGGARYRDARRRSVGGR